MPITNPSTDISGCILWLDAADPGTLFQDFAGTIPSVTNSLSTERVISLWRDKSSLNNHFSNRSALSTKPMLSANMQNGLSAVVFNGTFSNFLTGVVANFRTLSSATIIAVTQPLLSAGADIYSADYWCVGNIGTAGLGLSANRALALAGTTGGLTNERFTFIYESIAATTGRLGPSTYIRPRNRSEILTTTISTTGTVIYQNGRIVPLDLTSGITTTTNTAPTANSAGLSAFGNAAAVAGGVVNNFLLNGIRTQLNIPGPANNWLEFLIYDRVLTDTDRIDVENYIISKWNLTTPVYNAYGAANGLWSSPTTWLSNTLPTADSEVYTVGKTIVIDTDVTALSLRTGPGVFGGGGFEARVTGKTVTLLGAGIVAGTSTCVTSYLGGTETITVIGKITGSNTTANCVGIRNDETGITRCISPGGVRAGTVAGSHGATTGDSGSLFITGPCYGSDSIATAYGAYLPYIAYMNIVGDIVAGTLSPGAAFVGLVPDISIIRLAGNIYASANANGFAEIYSGSVRNNYCNIRISGNLKSGTQGHNAIDLINFTLYPHPYASATSAPSAVNAAYVKYSAVDDYTIYLHPEAKDTKLGVLYGALSLSGVPFQLIGTMGIPDRTAVSYNTPVGTSLGVGIVSVESLQSAWQAPLNSLKIAGSIGKRAYSTASIPDFGDLLVKINV